MQPRAKYEAKFVENLFDPHTCSGGHRCLGEASDTGPRTRAVASTKVLTKTICYSSAKLSVCHYIEGIGTVNV